MVKHLTDLKMPTMEILNFRVEGFSRILIQSEEAEDGFLNSAMAAQKQAIVVVKPIRNRRFVVVVKV